jgi:hypothetical protein
MLPKRRVCKVWQKMKCRFRRKHCSMVSSPNRVLTPLKRDSKIRISSFVPPSKIFVWEGWDKSCTFRSFMSPWNLCSPNEDCGRIDKRGNPDFRYTFQWFVAQIEYSRPWRVLPSKSGFPLLFLFPRWVKFMLHENKDLGRTNKRWNADFRHNRSI